MLVAVMPKPSPSAAESGAGPAGGIGGGKGIASVQHPRHADGNAVPFAVRGLS